MKALRASPILVLAAAFLGCGDPTATVTVKLGTPAAPTLDPYTFSDRMVQVRVTVDGSDRLDEAIADLALEERTATFESFPADRTIDVTVEGLDSLGNRIAYGEVHDTQVDDDVTVDVAFRRQLAYVIHRPTCGGLCGDGKACVNVLDGYACQDVLDAAACVDGNGAALSCGDDACVTYRGGPTCRPVYQGASRGPAIIYVIDLLTRELVDRVDLPGDRALGISARAGEGVLVTYTSGGEGFVSLLKSSDHTWETPLKLPSIQDMALLAPNQNVGFAAGGGFVTIFDWSTKETKRQEPTGGRILDGKLGGGGTRALFVINKEPGALLVQSDRPEEPLISVPVVGAAGVAIDEEGRVAYVTSSVDQSITGVDLDRNGTSAVFSGAPTCGAATFSAAIQSLLCIEAGSNARPRMHAWNVVSKKTAFDPVGALPEPSGIAAAPGGSRLVAVSAGTTTTSAGLTVMDANATDGPDGSTISYPSDPDDTFLLGSTLVHQRYQPYRVAVLYGR